MEIYKLTPEQSNQIKVIGNLTGKHLVVCDHGAGLSVDANFDESIYYESKSYIDSQSLPKIGLLSSDIDRLITMSRKIDPTSYSELPSTGTLKAGEVYSYSGNLVQVLQDHQRTIYPPQETPALFSVYRKNTEGMEWIANEQVLAGDTRTDNGKTYICIQSHTTQSGWLPSKTPALWKEVIIVVDIPVWVQPTGAHDAYALGAKVHFPTINDPVYESLIPANVYSPTAYPAGWRKL